MFSRRVLPLKMHIDGMNLLDVRLVVEELASTRSLSNRPTTTRVLSSNLQLTQFEDVTKCILLETVVVFSRLTSEVVDVD